MKNLLYLSFFTMSLLSSSCADDESTTSDCIDESKIDGLALCTTIAAPVCGCDGMTYQNDCFAQNAGVISWEDGACP